MAQRTIEQQLADIDKKRAELIARQGERKQTRREKLTSEIATLTERISDLENKRQAKQDEVDLIDREANDETADSNVSVEV